MLFHHLFVLCHVVFNPNLHLSLRNLAVFVCVCFNDNFFHLLSFNLLHWSLRVLGKHDLVHLQHNSDEVFAFFLVQGAISIIVVLSPHLLDNCLYYHLVILLPHELLKESGSINTFLILLSNKHSKDYFWHINSLYELDFF